MSYREITNNLLREEITNNLLKEIEETKGFSLKKLLKIIELNGILKEMQ